MRQRLKRAGLLAAGAILACCAAFAVAWHVFPFPIGRLDAWPTSPVVQDRTGRVMLSLVGRDEQWRRPVELDQVSPWLIKATVAVEDERFFSHGGVDLVAAARAAGQNAWSMRTVSGASTLTMQVCRMMEDKPRTISSKLLESFRALQLEQLRDKRQILSTYLNTAPYSGNLRGVEAAAGAWFRKRAADLTLGEAALLAGLPQSPSRYRPDRYPERAKTRRRHVLERMVDTGCITREQLMLADAEPVSVRRHRESARASHAAFLALRRRPGGGRTTIDPVIQADVESLARTHAAVLPERTQVAVVVVDVAASEVVALVGSADPRSPIDGAVNGILARRSPGSALKPFIYAAAMEAGLIDVNTTVYDIPIDRGGWTPTNFDQGFAGALPAADALRRSLNIPAILLAEAAGLPRCNGLIEAAGIRLPAGVHDRSGLAVVTGAAEATLLDLVNGYATLARSGTRCTPRLFMDESNHPVPAIDPAVCAILDEVLSSRRRRPRGMEERTDAQVPWFMWKTGTSSGRRDAWAIGHNRKHAIGVWIGRFAGGGATQYVGAEAAEPLLAALFDLPSVRVEHHPPMPPTRIATRPLGPPRELAGPLRILSPTAGARFVTLAGTAIIHPRANRLEGLTWFLNGRVLDQASASRLVLGPGQYELTCVDEAGQHTAARFSVLNRAASDTAIRVVTGPRLP